MGKINRCLKYLFIFFNVLFVILGCLMYYGAMKSSASIDQMSAVGAPIWIWVFIFGILGISCLGIYAGFSEKEIILKIFAGLMVVGMIIMLIFGIIVVDTSNKVKSGFYSTEFFKENAKLRAVLKELQQSHVFKIAMGMFFGFAVTALLGLLISCLMIHQVRRHDGSGGSSIAMRVY